MDRFTLDDSSAGSSRSSRASSNRYVPRKTYDDDMSGSSTNNPPFWSNTGSTLPNTTENFLDDDDDVDFFADSVHSYAPVIGSKPTYGASTTGGVGPSSHHGSTIVGTFRPTMEEMVDVNVSGHGGKPYNSNIILDGDGLFRTRVSSDRRSSIFGLSNDEINYDNEASHRNWRQPLLAALLLTMSIISLSVLVTWNSSSPTKSVDEVAPLVDTDSTITSKECDFEGILEPDVFLQCRCDGHISVFAEGILMQYNHLKNDFLGEVNFLPEFNSKIDSCDPANVALVWFSGDTFTKDESIMLDRYMLALVYAAFKGYNWTHQENWLSSQYSHCDWYGVECDTNGRTLDLLLSNNHLQGQIPTELVKLDSLRTIDFRGNYVIGRIPREIGGLVSLQNLRLNRNKLTFSIPTEIGFMTNLVSLELNENELVGTLPKEIIGIPTLSNIDLSSNRLTGSIPSEVKNLGSCREFKVHSNALSGSIPSEIIGMQMLTVWDSSLNPGHGSLPSHFSSLSKLVMLNVASMGLTGSIPSQLGNLTELQILSLSDNYFDKEIPSELGGMDALKTLALNHNALSGSIPSSLSQLRFLSEVYLQHNSLIGQIPDELASCEKLSFLDVSENQLEGTMPEVLCNMRQVGGLTSLVSDCAQLQCSIPNCCTSCGGN